MKPSISSIFENHKIDSYSKDWSSKNIDFQQNDNDAIIHWVARNGNSTEMRVLLEMGASINIKGDIGRTPLIEASSRNQEKIVLVLLEFGADTTEVDDYGDSALDMAEANNNPSSYLIVSTALIALDKKYK